MKQGMLILGLVCFLKSISITTMYNGCEMPNKVIILTTVISKNLIMNYGDGSSFRVKVLNSQGNPLKKYRSCFYSINNIIIMESIEMSKSLKEILSTPIKDTTVSEIRLQVVVGLPLPLIIIYFISLFSPYFISFAFGFLVLGVYMFFIKNIENHFDLYSEEEGKKYSFEGLCVESLLIGLIAFTSFLPFYYHFNKSFGFLISGILIFIRRKIFTESSRIIEGDDNLELGYHPLAYYILGIVCGFRLLSSSALLFIKYFTKGYPSLLTSIIFLIVSILYLILILSPDLMNKFIHFDLRKESSFFIYFILYNIVVEMIVIVAKFLVNFS